MNMENCDGAGCGVGGVGENGFVLLKRPPGSTRNREPKKMVSRREKIVG